jgi:signal transduction histidine kinase/CHASE3 domain sensor protein
VSGGLTRRTIVASGLLALLVGAAFAVLVRTVVEEQRSADRAVRSLEAITTATSLERLVLDLETGQRGFLVTGEERFLEPWRAARQRYPGVVDSLIARTRGANGQAAAARQIAAAVDAYVDDYSVPLVDAARRDEPYARSPEALADGKRRVDALRARLDRFVDAERARFETRMRGADADARRAILGATLGLAGSTLLIVLFGGYLARAVAWPVRRASLMAGRLSGGDLSTRMPETGAGEVGTLARAFNSMAGSLEKSQDDLRRIADEQAALRRVATLVARDVAPDQLFQATAAEVHGLLAADAAVLLRYESDAAAVVLATSAGGEFEFAQGQRFPLEEGSVIATVHRTGQPARVDHYAAVAGSHIAELQKTGINAALGAPIVVGARLWGVMVAIWRDADAMRPGHEERMAQFTELVATAIANAQSRAELTASRARVVATADETRRRIERDLHDGAQQSLVHVMLNLKLARRAIRGADGSAAELVDEALEHAERANAELRDLAHGILPATLSRGLDAAVETLVSRIRLPVSVDVTTDRLPPELEATAYFVVAEALTNTVKHAGATRAEVAAVVRDGVLHVEVRDNGVGGAQTDGHTGLLGLYDRVAAMDGELHVKSPPGVGTTVAARIPVPAS